MTAEPPTRYGGGRLRADAQRNRDQLLESARTLFSRHGVDVPMEEIARHAGVGVGTLYRRFADRDELIRQLAVDTLGRLLADAEAAERTATDGWRTLSGFLRGSVHLRLIVRLGMFSPRAAQVLKETPEFAELRRGMLAILERLVSRAQEEGAMRRDVGAGDVTALLAMVLHVPPAVAPERAALVFDRCLAVLLDGLSTGPGSTLPGRAMTAADVSAWSV